MFEGEIIKPKVDNRTYKGLTLQNGLKVVLIKDEESTISSACMYVRVGSLKDPIEFQGLAHFLEHMLFLGSKKYPEDGTYKKFISMNGGKCNASTNKYHTQYYFTIKNEKLVDALDMFAQFFISPLLNEDCTQREVNAVDAEAAKNLTQDSRKYYQLMRHLSDEKSVLNKYQTGNLKTLSKPGLREALEEFHKKYYSADIMTLAIYHNQDEMELAEKVQAMFSDVPNKSIGKISFLDETFPYPQTHLGKYLKWVSVNNKRILRLRWVFPDMTKHQHKGVMGYLTHLLGHECPGSPAYLLLEDNLITNLSSSSDSDEDLFSYIEISIELTDKGYEHIQDILEVIGLYIVLIKEEGVHAWVHEERKLLKQLRFDFKSNTGPADTVETLARGLSDNDFADCMYGYYRFTDFDEGLVRSTLDLLKPENAFVSLSAKTFGPDVEFPDSEPIYSTKFIKQDLSKELAAKLLPSNEEVEKSSYTARLRLPDRNVYIPRSTELLPADPSEVEQTDKPIPSLVAVEPHLSLFHLKDTSFGFPKIHFYMEIADNTFNQFQVNINRLYYSMWLALLNLEFRSEKYNFELSLASLATSLGNGVEIRVKCFHDTLPAIVQTLPRVFQKMNSFDNEVLFRQILTKQQQQVENRLKGQPSSVNQLFLGQILRVPEVPDTAILEWFQKVTWQDFKSFKDQIFRQKVRYFSMLEGNITKDHAVSMTKEFITAFESVFKPSGHLPVVALPEKRCLMVARDTTYVYKRFNSEATEPNSALLVYYQFGQHREKRAQYFFIESFLRSAFFNELRTKQQLGYVVSTSLFPAGGVFGLTFAIQSNHKLPEYCRERIEEHLSNERTRMKNLSEKEFSDIVSGLLAVVKKPYTSLFDQSDAHLDQILMMRLQCTSKQELEEQLNQLKLEDVQTAFEQMFFGGTPRIEIHTIPASKSEEYQREADMRATKTPIPRVSDGADQTQKTGIAGEVQNGKLRYIENIELLKKTEGQFPDPFWVNFAEAVNKQPLLKIQIDGH